MVSPSPLEAHLDIVRAPGVAHAAARRASPGAASCAGAASARADALGAITIRPAAARDAAAIALLALLDGQRLLAGGRLVAEADGRILAAAEIASGRTVADPLRADGRESRSWWRCGRSSCARDGSPHDGSGISPSPVNSSPASGNVRSAGGRMWSEALRSSSPSGSPLPRTNASSSSKEAWKRVLVAARRPPRRPRCRAR